MKVSDALRLKFGISRRKAKGYIKDRLVVYNSRKVYKDIFIENIELLDILIQKMDLSYKLEDYLIKNCKEVLFFYKPPFMHTERIKFEDGLCLSDILEEHFPRHKLVSRLDYETDGVVSAVLKGIIIEKQEKRYYAWINGTLDKDIIIDRKIDSANRKKVRVLDEKGDNALNIYVVKKLGNRTLVDIHLQFAHRHQIRATMEYLGCPIVGDKLYGEKDWERLLLQCYYTRIGNYECWLDKGVVLKDIFLDKAQCNT